MARETPPDTLDRWWRVARARALALVAGRRLDAEVDEELAFHAAMAQAEAEARGAPPQEARLAARRRVDGVALRRDQIRDGRGFAWLDAIRQDLRHAWRGLRRTPFVTVTAIASLALGLGATASLFAVVDAVLLRPLPLPDAGRVVWLGEQRHGEESTGTPLRLADWSRLESFVAVAGYYGDEPFVRTGTVDLGRLPAVRTFGALFDVLGVEPILGRLPTPGEQRSSGPAVVLLGEHAWRTRFAAEPAVVGRTLRVDRILAEIIGVLPDAAAALTDADLWMPAPPELQASARSAGFLSQIARLHPAASLASAQVELDAQAARLARAFPDTDRGLGARLIPLRTHLGADARTPLLVLLAAVAMVLLVASLNVASLMLARGIGRWRDAALRVAIGAGRARLLQLHLIEGAIVAASGAAAGLAIAWFGVDVLKLVLPDSPGLADARVDLRLLVTMAALAAACTLVVGILPALLAWRAAASPLLRLHGGTGSGPARSRARSALVVLQVAVAAVLITGAGLLALALDTLGHRPRGFRHSEALTFRVELPWDSEPQRIADVTTRVLDRLERAPGVVAAGVVDRLPFGGGSQTTRILIDGVALPTDLVERPVAWRTASAGYFSAIGLPQRRGERYPDRWMPGMPRVAVVNERFVRLFLGGRDPIGREVGGYRRAGGDVPRYRIVGVVGDLRTSRDETAAMPAVYVPAGATFWPILNFAVRADTTKDASRLLPMVLTLAGELAPDVVVEDVRTMDEHLALSLREPRTRTWIVAGFAGIALLLSAIGLYGLLASEVASRVTEIGIRLALGASAGRVLSATLDRGLRLALGGLALGLLVAPFAARLIEGVLGGASARDWRPFGLAFVVLAVVAVLASLGPAWRAARIDPNRALRTE